MIEYLVVYDHDAEDLSKMITRYLKAGWQLQGGVSCSTVNAHSQYAQAIFRVMAKRTRDDD